MIKTSLDYLFEEKQSHVNGIVDVVQDEFDLFVHLASKEGKRRSRILLILLFGSYAKAPVLTTSKWLRERLRYFGCA